jgi:hypothetical protein
LVPYWGLALLGTVLAFVLPLVYVTNKELIDHHLKNASNVVEAQTSQVRNVAQKQAEQVTAIGKQYAGDYTGKVQEMLRGKGGVTAEKGSANPVAFPKAPTNEPGLPSVPTEEPKKATDVPAPSVPSEPLLPNKDEPLIS